jgi:hypothetical protein
MQLIDYICSFKRNPSLPENCLSYKEEGRDRLCEPLATIRQTAETVPIPVPRKGKIIIETLSVAPSGLHHCVLFC